MYFRIMEETSECPTEEIKSGRLCGIGKEVGKEDRGERDLYILLSPI